MCELIPRFTQGFESRFGYPPGENVLVRVASEAESEGNLPPVAVGVSEDLLCFYGQVERLSLPDLDSGFFIHQFAEVVNGEQPKILAGDVSDSIVVFGSDGGGGLFALSVTQGNVYSLSGGALIGDIYETEGHGVTIISRDLWGFLEGLRGELINSISHR
ncbi:hypothetical protein ABZU25_31775 [Micromonospora sp. NPDC005215]|uniref:hypothetical protein n=1 Tax=Micromonospora sp. NPDC005215 TaxID=3157024 RepID=UPI0033A6F4E8